MEFLTQYTFKYPWRKYQKKVLHELPQLLTDRKINIVAAPGAGKTVLGLEIVRQLNCNVLILAPTLTIKNQWADRFLELFVGEKPKPDFISTDIYKLNRFNIATYQALHYAYNRKKIEETLESEEEETTSSRAVNIAYDLVEELKAREIQVIVLDEAHHLRSAWWKSLTDVLKALPEVQTVSLTATPPYDAEKREWDKYTTICGAVDHEITVPELVATGDLCTHQDFVIFNKLLPEEEQKAIQIKEDIAVFIENLKVNQNLLTALHSMPELNGSTLDEEKVLEHPQYYSSIIIFLNNAGLAVNPHIAAILGGGAPIPKLDVKWLEIMLQGLLYEDKTFAETNRPIVKEISTQLHKIGVLLRGKVSLQENNEIKRLMAGSFGKMGSIAEIVWNEHAALGNDLSMVILTDYVRSEALKDDMCNKLGVVPIFKRIIQDIGITPSDDPVVAGKIINIAVLCGKLKIIPEPLIPLIEEKIPCQFQETCAAGYVEIKTAGKHENELVGIITNLMNEKKINIIIGTAALLGEGWDCRAVNSLVLASFVGSYMLSNQMRGRAIRSDKSQNKVANIWHLVSLTKGDYDSKNMFSRHMDLNDFQLLKRRFQSFLGIAYHSDSISNGINRLDVIHENNLSLEFEEINKQMYRISRTRQNTKKRFLDILNLYGGEDIEIVHTLKADLKTERRFKAVAVRELRKSFPVVAPLIGAGGLLIYGGANGYLGVLSPYQGAIILLLAAAVLLPRLRRFFGNFSPVSNMKLMSKVVLCALKDLGYIKSAQADSKVQVSGFSEFKTYQAELLGSTAYENNLFIQCMREIYQRVDNPRYLIVFENKRGTKQLYFNVPSVFSDHKTKALQFFMCWKKHMGFCKLIYTRTEEGRKILLQARKGSFDYENRTSQQQQAVKGKGRWR